MNQENSLKMRNKPIGYLIFTMSIPAIFSMFIQALYNVVDTFYVGQLDVANDFNKTALGYAYPIQILVLAVSLGIGIGTNVIVARKLGEKEQDEASNVARTGILLSVGGSIIFFLLSFIIVTPFMNFMSNIEGIRAPGIDYLRIVLMFSTFSIMEITLSKILQGTGQMIIPMISQLLGALTNIILDPLFIFGRLGLPAMGVKGAAIATVIAQGVSLVFVVLVIIFRKQELNFGFKKFKIKMAYVKHIFQVGLPSMVMNVLGAATNIFLNKIVSTHDPYPHLEVANGVLVSYTKLQSFVFMPVFGLNQGGLPILSYNFGAREKQRFKHAQKILYITAVLIMVVGTLIFQLFPRQLLGIFSPSNELLELGEIALRIISISFIPAGVAIITTISYQSLGKGLSALLMSLARQALLLVPLAFILGKLGNLNTVWFAFPISEIIVTIIFSVFLVKIVNNSFKQIDDAKFINSEAVTF